MINSMTMARDHRENVVEAKQPKRDQEREGSFRTVCRRAQGIQSKDGDAGRRPDLLPVLLPVGQRTADEDVEKWHGFIVLRAHNYDANRRRLDV